MGLQKRMAGADTQGGSRFLAFRDPQREDGEVHPSVMLPTQSEGKGEWESGLTCLPAEEALCGIF